LLSIYYLQNTDYLNTTEKVTSLTFEIKKIIRKDKYNITKI